MKLLLDTHTLLWFVLDDARLSSKARNQLTVLPITTKHASVTASLPFHHRDPFDRLLIAQAITEQVPLLSADKAFDAYPVRRIW